MTTEPTAPKPPLPRNLRLRQALKDIYHGTPATSGAALAVVIHEALAMEKALRYYADEDHYIDGVAQLVDSEDNLLTIPDEGFTAQWALHLTDISYGPFLPAEKVSAEEDEALDPTD